MISKTPSGNDSRSKNTNQFRSCIIFVTYTLGLRGKPSIDEPIIKSGEEGKKIKKERRRRKIRILLDIRATVA